MQKCLRLARVFEVYVSFVSYFFFFSFVLFCFVQPKVQEVSQGSGCKLHREVIPMALHIQRQIRCSLTVFAQRSNLCDKLCPKQLQSLSWQRLVQNRAGEPANTKIQSFSPALSYLLVYMFSQCLFWTSFLQNSRNISEMPSLAAASLAAEINASVCHYLLGGEEVELVA